MAQISFRKLSPWIVVAAVVIALILFLYPRKPPEEGTSRSLKKTEEKKTLVASQDAAVEKSLSAEPAVLTRPASASASPEEKAPVHWMKPARAANNPYADAQQAILSALQETATARNGRELAQNLAAETANRVISSGLSAARKSDLAPLAHLELELFPTDETGWGVAASTLVPFYESAEKKHTAFTQLSFRADREEFVSAEGEKSLISEKVASAGLVYRNFSEDRRYLWGLNTFADSDLGEHWRASLGADIDWGTFAVSGNYYHALSGWQDSVQGFESRVRAGFDLEARGRLKPLDGAELGLRGFTWAGYEGQENVNGLEVSARYRPISLVGFNGAYSFHDGDLPLWQIGVSLLYQMGIPWREQTRRLTYDEKVDLRQLRHAKVRREDRLIMQERIDGANTVTVAFLRGAMSVTNERGTFSVKAGDRFAYPATVLLSPDTGDVAGLSFSDGAKLSAGAGSSFAISQAGISQLGAGFLRYRSGAVKRSLSMASASVRLIGTEVELRNDGGQSTIGVLQGRIVAEGSGYRVEGGKSDIIDAFTGEKLKCHGREPHIDASNALIDGPSLRVSAWGVFSLEASCLPPSEPPSEPAPEHPGEDPGSEYPDDDHGHHGHDHDHDHHGPCGCGHH